MATEHGPPFCWSPPILEERRVTLRPAVVRHQLLLGVDGNWTNADVYVRVPVSWQDVTLSLVLRQEFMNLAVGEAQIGDAEHPRIEGGLFEGLVLSVRGRPMCGRINVYAERGNAPLGEIERHGYVLINAWGSEGGSPSDRAGQQLVQRFSPRHAVRQFAGTLDAAGLPTPIFPAEADRRVYLTSLSYTTDDPVQRVLTIESPAGTVRRRYVTSDQYAIVDAFDPPLRSERAALWQAGAVVIGGGTINGLNVQGFVE